MKQNVSKQTDYEFLSKMVKCWQCGNELFFYPINKKEIIIRCSSRKCGFKSQPLQLDPDFKLPEISEIPEFISQKPKKSSIIHQRDKIEEKIHKEKINSKPLSENQIPQVILKRTGNLNQFSIYCLDFSNRMDMEIFSNKEILEKWIKIIKEDDVLTTTTKENLEELINPPISNFRSILFALSLLILQNLKKMTVEDFQSFQIISMAQESEEIFRFPNFSNNTTPELINDFINIIKIRRKDYKANEMLEYRDFSSAFDEISKLATEIKEKYSNKKIDIFLLTAGGHKPLGNKSLNPIREIRHKMEGLEPYSFNIINMDPKERKIEKAFEQISKRFYGQYSKEFSFKGIMNALLFRKYGTDANPKKSSKRPKSHSKEEMVIENVADDILKKLKENLHD